MFSRRNVMLSCRNVMFRWRDVMLGENFYSKAFGSRGAPDTFLHSSGF